MTEALDTIIRQPLSCPRLRVGSHGTTSLFHLGFQRVLEQRKSVWSAQALGWTQLGLFINRVGDASWHAAHVLVFPALETPVYLSTAQPLLCARVKAEDRGA